MSRQDANAAFALTSFLYGGNAAYIEEVHLDRMASEPYRALLEALLLRYQPAFLNILPMYIVVLAAFAAALPLLRRPARKC